MDPSAGRESELVVCRSCNFCFVFPGDVFAQAELLAKSYERLEHSFVAAVAPIPVDPNAGWLARLETDDPSPISLLHATVAA